MLKKAPTFAWKPSEGSINLTNVGVSRTSREVLANPPRRLAKLSQIDLPFGRPLSS
ncbi:MAG: hypothetical protein ACTS53_01290 [Candidatus Hodgkinia cicadicola]